MDTADGTILHHPRAGLSSSLTNTVEHAPVTNDQVESQSFGPLIRSLRGSDVWKKWVDTKRERETCLLLTL